MNEQYNSTLNYMRYKIQVIGTTRASNRFQVMNSIGDLTIMEVWMFMPLNVIYLPIIWSIIKFDGVKWFRLWILDVDFLQGFQELDCRWCVLQSYKACR